MYHYVRDLENSRFPRIKGLLTAAFEEQVRYIMKHYNVISGAQLLEAVTERAPLPPRSAMLTFDDGYMDHFSDVLPILSREGISGCFFPPAKAVLEHRVLDVNKIQFVLASVADPAVLVDHMFAAIAAHRREWGLASPEEYWRRLATPCRYDGPDIMFCKRMLQYELPEQLRAEITDELFRAYVTEDEQSFAAELYMSPEQIEDVREAGNLIGSHSYDHVWLDKLDPAERERQISLSLDFLNSVGADTRAWMMCYPYGGCDSTLMGSLRSHGCVVGLTTEVDVARLGETDPLALPRLDTNDLPKRGDAEPVEWTSRACGES